jgi:hypothetical protein
LVAQRNGMASLFLQAVLDVLDVFFSEIQEPAGGRGIGDWPASRRH